MRNKQQLAKKLQNNATIKLQIDMGPPKCVIKNRSTHTQRHTMKQLLLRSAAKLIIGSYLRNQLTLAYVKELFFECL